MAAPDAAEKLFKAASEVGFQCLINHGVEAEAAEGARALEEMLVNKTRAELNKIRKPTPGYGPGLQYDGHMQHEAYETEEGVYTTGARDDFVVVHPDAAKHKAEGLEYWTGPGGKIWYADATNRFPTESSGRALEAHYLAMEGVALKVLRLMATSIAGDASAFDHLVTRHTTNLVNGFHPAAASAGGEQTRVSGHSDTGLFTIINYGSSGFSGLEVRDHASGEWRIVDPAAFPKGGLLLNTGDSMHRLSNSRLLSTPHRVIERSPHGTELPARLAMIYFFAASYNATLTPVVQPGETAHYEPIVAGRLAHNYLTCSPAERQAFDEWCNTTTTNAQAA